MPGHFLAELRARSRDKALEELLDCLVKTKEIKSKELVLEMLRQREKLGSTGIGKGVAIPHGRTLVTSKLAFVLGRSSKGIDFVSVDGQPVRLFFLILAPPQDPGNLYLQVLGKVAALARQKGLRTKLLNAKDQDEVKDILLEVQ
jgi:PTS system nitrogen regulatory IIA component